MRNFFACSQKNKMAAVDSEKMVFCTIMYHNVGVLDIILILSCQAQQILHAHLEDRQTR